jgi:hypothetical protein
MSGNKRRFTRVGYRIEATILYADKMREVRVENLSLHGAYLYANDLPDVGENVQLTIQLGQSDEILPLQIEARIVRHESNSVGISFEGMDLDSFSALKNILIYQGGNADAINQDLANFIES